MKIVAIVCIFLLLGCTTTGSNAPRSNPSDYSSKTQTTPLPATSLALTPLSGGSATNLDEYLGNGAWTLVMFWSSVMHISMFEEVLALSDEADKSKLTIVGVSIDRPQDVNKSRETQHLNEADYPNYRANQAEIFALYELIAEKQFRGTPSFILYDRQGKPTASEVGIVKRDRVMSFINKND